MRRIDKNNIIASKYIDWLKSIEGKAHPEYSSSKEFYYDIVANLIWVQNGLCAYTERHLQNCARCAPELWKDGKYKKFKFSGQLDHYDNTLKSEYGWLWSNFFLVDSDVNMKEKRSNTPFGILKPDKEDFNPIELLDYDIKNHIFYPNKKQGPEIQEKILKEISYLGLNFQPILDQRKAYLNPIINRVKYDQQSLESAEREIYQFFTAFELLKSQIN